MLQRSALYEESGSRVHGAENPFAVRAVTRGRHAHGLLLRGAEAFSSWLRWSRSKGSVQVLLDRLEESVRDVLRDLRQGHPRDLSDFGGVRHVRGPADHLAGRVGHLPTGDRMDPLAQSKHGDHVQAGLLLRLANGGILAGLARFDFARRELP